MFVNCFGSQWMKRSKHGLFVFPNMEKALFDWPMVLHYDVKAKNRLISRKFSGISFFHQSKATRVCIRSTNQSNRSISVRFFFLFCSRVFISRSYKNRSQRNKNAKKPRQYSAEPVWIKKHFNILYRFRVALESILTIC